MTQFRTAISLATLLLAFPVALPAQGESVVSATAEAVPASPKTQMKAINQSMKKVSAFLKAPEGKAPIADVIVAQMQALEAKRLLPSLAVDKTDDEREAFLKAYRKQMNSLVRNLLDLEDALEAGDLEAAGKAAAACGQDKKQGHGEFKGRRKR